MSRRRRKDRERDLERELRSHLELEAEERRESGLSEGDARYAAQRALGNTTFIQEEVRRMWGFEKLEQIGQDVRYAFRGMRKSPGFAATAVLSLALGIGANTAIFTVVNAVLLRPLPFPEPDRLVQLWESRPNRGYLRNVINGMNFMDWRDRSHSFENIAAVSRGSANLTGVGDPVAVEAMQVSPAYFSVLRVSPAIGRNFTEADGQQGRNNVVILSHRLWQTRFGGETSVLGRSLSVNGMPSTIVGVMPAGFRLPKRNAELWQPLAIARTPEFERGRSMTAIGRLKPGVTLAQAVEDLHAVAAQYGRERPAFNEGWSAEAFPMLEDATEDVRLPLLVLLAAVGLVLLIACANVANLLLMRGAGRLREISVRAALGAGKARLLQQLLLESLALAGVACVIGVAAGWAGSKALLALIPGPAQLPRLNSVHMDGWVVLFALALALITAVVSGLVPFFQVSQIDPHQALQQGAGRSTSRSGIRRALVVVEVALSLVLLVGAGLMLRSFHRLTTLNPGFDSSRVLTLSMLASPTRYAEAPKRAAYFGRLLDEIRNVPGVQEAGSTHFLPLQERVSGSCFAPADEPPPIPARSPGAGFLVVSPGYFQTMRTPLVAGRHFDSRDRPGTPSTIIVNQAFVRQYLAGKEPLGQKLNVCWTVENPVEIVGVVADSRQTTLQAAVRATIFVNNLQAPMYFSQFVVRTSSDPMLMARAVEAAIRRVDPDQAVSDVQAMETVASDSVAQPRLQVALLSVFASIAGALAIVGVYGVVAYSATRRIREIGIRMALGAVPRDVRKLLLREGLVLGGAGVVIGLGGALALTRVLRNLLFETAPNDPATLATVAGGILAVVFLATLIPANRAAATDPTTALRHE
jgi:putative ABC transport system permease protein